MITRRNVLSTLTAFVVPGFIKTYAEQPAETVPVASPSNEAAENKSPAKIVWKKEPETKSEAKADEMSSKDSKLSYLKNDSVDFKKLLPTPPKISGDETKAELELLLHLQRARTDAEVAGVEASAKLTLNTFASIFGNGFAVESLPETVALLKKLEKDSKFFTTGGKEFFNRPRPAHDSRIHPALSGDDEPSYPSGHSTRGMLFALTLAELDPGKHEALMDRGRSIGWARCVAGVHYPSDIIAGRVLAQALFQAMSANPKFTEALNGAKAEWAKAKKV